jgi:ribonuclease VapC
MFVDASAIVAILSGEDDAELYVRALARASGRSAVTSPVAIYEATLGVARRLGCSTRDAEDLVNQLLLGAKVRVIPLTDAHAIKAIAAQRRFGKPHHPAALNMGDCFAYAVAKSLALPMLFKGNDFSATDMEDALSPD